MVENWVLGYTIVGGIPDSGLFRPQETPPTVPPETFSLDSNRVWTDSVIRQVTAAATAPSADDHKVLRAVSEQTRKEACKGYVKGPLTRYDLNQLFGKHRYRVQVRFGVEQGPPGARKVRAIDNAKSALSNAISHTHETITCITFEFAAVVSALVLEECIAAGIAMLEMAVASKTSPPPTASLRPGNRSTPSFASGASATAKARRDPHSTTSRATTSAW